MYCLLLSPLFLTLKSKLAIRQLLSRLVVHTAASFTENMVSGRTSFIYFVKQANPTVKTFIEQLEMSADALEDYGILIGKVNCSEETIEKYCTEEEVMKKIHLFRGPDVLRSFDIDTVFDVNAIVSHVLFAVLFDEVRCVHTPAELGRVERAAKGTADVVMGHIRVLGLPEHRALMEAAFVYGAKYQFVQTSGTLLLRHMEIADPSDVQACLWFLHCRTVSRLSEPCPHTLMRKPLTTINIHTFLQLMEAPLLTEAAVDPAEVDVVYSHLNVPVIFLFSRPETVHLDRVTAETLAWRLRGEAGLVLIHRDNPSVKTPLVYNAAYRLPQEQSLRYFTLKNVEEVVTLLRDQLLPKEREKQDKEEEIEYDWSGVDVLDDEVAESVYRDRGLMLDMDKVPELTADTFSAAVMQHGLMVVLFYVKWDAVSMAFLQSFVEVAHALEGVNGLDLASVNCGEWTDVCGDQNITSFPFVLLYQPGEAAQPYRGMLGAESLHTFLLLRQDPSPLELSSLAEVASFLEGDLYSRHLAHSPVRVMGLFTSADQGVAVFVEAAKSLRGEILLGLFVNKVADAWTDGHTVSLPALLVSRGPGVQQEAHTLLPSTSQNLAERIRCIVLDTFPELTVENLPWYLEQGKPLLLLFVGGGEGPLMTQPLEEMRMAQSVGQLVDVLPCWIHLGRTPAGRSVLKAYLGFVPPLPALVLSRIGGDGEVFHFPPERPLLSKNIVQWLQRIENNQEQCAGAIPEVAWDPPVPFYDFLAIMDEEAPGYAAQRSPKVKPKGKKEQPAGEARQEAGTSAGRGAEETRQDVEGTSAGRGAGEARQEKEGTSVGRGAREARQDEEGMFAGGGVDEARMEEEEEGMSAGRGAGEAGRGDVCWKRSRQGEAVEGGDVCCKRSWRGEAGGEDVCWKRSRRGEAVEGGDICWKRSCRSCS
ncbi:thioredoxin domain-containing protein 16 isoform X3 [Electrophorus electricus]|uniref:thioredoxin domain-containing protein 16 isoform X3 n=1 Tax=Electrophorus electricus TaxID=8005 RepID=UPI0015D040D4|nr:thioredoxin domain-containing protein 16 isoform X3 [Electrophorus electricus]